MNAINKYIDFFGVEKSLQIMAKYINLSAKETEKKFEEEYHQAHMKAIMEIVNKSQEKHGNERAIIAKCIFEYIIKYPDFLQRESTRGVFSSKLLEFAADANYGHHFLQFIAPIGKLLGEVPIKYANRWD